MKRRARLRRRSEFSAAIDGRRFHQGRALVGFAVPSAADEHRVGVTVSRNIKGATERNRARRRLREVARAELLGDDSPLRQGGIRYDVVLIARPAALEMSFADLRAEASQAALRLANTKP
ncbi:MAG TPA: ribonuclease P protein component [Candidatus Dormibacteraeota bacterium]|nr:ribonuclease P protein component [Candidatus Dormibacteraeota bacterium]